MPLSENLRELVNDSMSIEKEEMQLTMKSKLNAGFKKRCIILLMGDGSYNISRGFESKIANTDAEVIEYLKKYFSLDKIQAIFSDTICLLLEVPAA